jgi:hypothetical protein
VTLIVATPIQDSKKSCMSSGKPKTRILQTDAERRDAYIRDADSKLHQKHARNKGSQRHEVGKTDAERSDAYRCDTDSRRRY